MNLKVKVFLIQMYSMVLKILNGLLSNYLKIWKGFLDE